MKLYALHTCLDQKRRARSLLTAAASAVTTRTSTSVAQRITSQRFLVCNSCVLVVDRNCLRCAVLYCAWSQQSEGGKKGSKAAGNTSKNNNDNDDDDADDVTNDDVDTVRAKQVRAHTQLAQLLLRKFYCVYQCSLFSAVAIVQCSLFVTVIQDCV
jgi:hypothetical protein